MHLKLLLALVFSIGGAAQASAQETIGLGDPLPALELKDQHEHAGRLPEDLRRVLLVADNAGTALATELIEGQPPAWLSREKLVFLADIHKMPGLIAKLVAIPRLREKPYTILLGRTANELQMFPRRKDCVTVIGVREGKVGEIVHACNRQELLAASGL